MPLQFSVDANRIFKVARSLAAADGCTFVIPAHVNRAILSMPTSPSHTLMVNTGVKVRELKAHLENLHTSEKKSACADVDSLRNSPRTIKMLEHAEISAKYLKDNLLGGEHLVLGTLCLDDDPANNALRGHGLTYRLLWSEHRILCGAIGEDPAIPEVNPELDVCELLITANHLAHANGHDQVDPIHTLAVLLRTSNCIGFQAVTESGATPGNLLGLIDFDTQIQPGRADTPISPEVEHLLDVAFLAARTLGHKKTNTGHVLLALERIETDPVAKIVRDNLAPRERLEALVDRLTNTASAR